MKETRKTLYGTIELFDSKTGELTPTDINQVVRDKYYSVKNLNFRGAIMDLFGMQSQICKGSKDIMLFGILLNNVNKDNELIILNMTNFAKQHDYTRQRFTLYMKDCVESGLMRKIETGRYLVNPFAFKAKGCSYETIERLQRQWNGN